jgi:hypothetical protein
MFYGGKRYLVKDNPQNDKKFFMRTSDILMKSPENLKKAGYDYAAGALPG